MANSRANDRIATDYKKYRGMLFAKKFFEAGIGIVTPIPKNHNGIYPPQVKIDEKTDSSGSNKKVLVPLIDGNTLNLKDRAFTLLNIDDDILTKPELKEAFKEFKKIQALLGKINCPVETKNFLRNVKRREEIFLPITFQTEQDKFGLYIYPWRSQKSEIKNFKGFNEFVTAVCMFGSSLQGIDPKGASFPLIKHNIEFYSGQKVQRIEFDEKKSHPYKEMTLIELDRIASLIKQFSCSNEPKLRIHLPWTDYILFGLDLFMKNCMTLEAMKSLIITIIAEKDRYMTSIKSILAKHKIQVIFETPFDNLFSDFKLDYSQNNIDDSSEDDSIKSGFTANNNSNENLYLFLNDTAEIICQKIFSIVGIPYEENNSPYPENEIKTILQKYLIQLQTNNANKEQKNTWKFFSQLIDFSTNINNIEDLLRMGNSLVLANAAYNKNNYEVCSLLPLSEKQIQVNFESIIKKNAKKLTFPAIYFITFMEPLYSYNPDTNDCSLFYFNTAFKGDLSKTILKDKIVDKAFQNIFLFSNKEHSQNKEPYHLEDVLKPKTRIK